MTLQGFRDILLTADSQASHYESKKRPNYTVWSEYGDDGLSADSIRQESAWKIQVDRYTKLEYDPVVDAIRAALDRDDISYEYSCDFEQDTGYIHHIFDCEVA